MLNAIIQKADFSAIILELEAPSYEPKIEQTFKKRVRIACFEVPQVWGKRIYEHQLLCELL